MQEMSNKFVPEHKGEKNYSKKILKLAQKITDRLFAKVTPDDPEYWGLACVIDDEIADVALKMDIRKPYTFKQLVKMNKIPAEGEAKFLELLEKMAKIGIMEYDYGDCYTKDGPIPGTKFDKEHRRYWIPLFVPGSAEYTNMNLESLHKHPELAIFFELMTFLPLENVTALVPPGGCGVGMHVIPVEKAIECENKSIDIEHISYWLKRYEGHIGASICSCRVGRKLLDEGCADDYEDWCIGVGDMADYCRETGRGHDVTYEEAMAILKRAEDNGFVHQITNIDGEDKIFAICNCNLNICNALRTSQLFNTPNMSRSAYVAHVDTKACVACGRCVEYCPAGALKLGQKLCTKNGPIEYPKVLLPDNNRWGKSRWSENYRDDNRINCHTTGTAPCKTACPAHIAVQGYLKMAAQGRYKEALALIKKRNPFPAICGRICNRRCEAACTRGTIDQAVAIDAVKKFIAEQDLNAKTRYVPDVIVASNKGRWKEKIAIIGGGPAGLSCAYYLATKGYYPTVFEKNAQPGGMMAYGIPSYKLSRDVINAEIDILKEIGVEIKCGVEVGKDITLDQLRKEGYKGFFVAIGCQGGRKLNIPNEDASNVTSAIDFLHDYTEGKKKITGNVVVFGGGNVAIDAARVAKRSGAKSVKMVSLETRDIMPADKLEVKEALEEGIELFDGFGPKAFNGKGKVKDVEIKKCVSVFDKDGKFNPSFDENDVVTLEADYVIEAIGQTAVCGDLFKDSKVVIGRGNRPEADKLTLQTAEEDVFVGGDFYLGPKFVIDAIAQGYNAAESLHRYVQHGHMTIGRNKNEFIALDKENIVVESYDNSSRQVEGIKDGVDVKTTFEEYEKTFTEKQVKIETARCLGCGATIVDSNKCIGCGLCTTKCEFDAIHLSRDLPQMSTMVKAEKKVGPLLKYVVKRAPKVMFKKKVK